MLKMIEGHKGITVKKNGEEAYEAKVDDLIHALLTAGEKDKTLTEVNNNANIVQDRGGGTASNCN